MKAKEIYEKTLASIVEALEAGVKPWEKSWQTSLPYNLTTKKPYRGMNILILWNAAMQRSHECQAWLTFMQAQKLGGKVRKGERATHGCFFQPKREVEVDDDGETKVRSRWIAAGFSVFNIDQVEGLPEEVLPPTRAAPLMGADMAEAAGKIDELVHRHGAIVRTGGHRACFIPSHDVIQMPPRRDFDSAENYYATLLHELTHWTGGEKRLNRGFSFGRQSLEYAFEELVAEMGSAFCCATLGIRGTIENHASYINGWLEIAGRDKKALGRAASQASAAHEFLMSKLGEADEAEATLPEAA